MQLVLDTNGIIVKVRNAAFWIISKTQQRTISPTKITSIAITQDCLLSSAAIRLAVKHQIPIIFFNGQGKAEARLWSPYFSNIATIRRKQIQFFTLPQATEWGIDLFKLKTLQQQQLLQQVRRRKRTTQETIDKTILFIQEKVKSMDDFRTQPIKDVRANLMGIEGIIAKQYWSALSSVFPIDWQYEKRSRRPAEDKFNATLNYLYGMLYSITEGALFATGLDPQLGMLHVDMYNRPTLAFDLIEPFRPWIDQLLVELIFGNQLTDACFEEKDGGIFVSKTGKTIIIPAFNGLMQKKITFLEHNLSHKNHIHRFAAALVQRIQNAIPEGDTDQQMITNHSE